MSGPKKPEPKTTMDWAKVRKDAQKAAEKMLKKKEK
jgi:hypothetical protein